MDYDDYKAAQSNPVLMSYLRREEDLNVKRHELMSDVEFYQNMGRRVPWRVQNECRQYGVTIPTFIPDD